MDTETKTIDKQFNVKRYKVHYPISAYMFPKETCIHQVRLDDTHIHIELTDERILSIPLWWIPTLYNASPEEREKYEINHSRTMLIWNPDNCSINDEISIANYMLTSEPELLINKLGR